MKDLNYFIGETVHDNVRRNDKLARASDFPRSARAGKRRELLDAADNRLSEFPGGFGIILLNVLNCGFQLVGGSGCPPK